MAVRRRVHTGIVGLAAAAVAATAFTSPAHAGPGKGHAATQRAMDAMVADEVPGVTAAGVDKGDAWRGTSGVGDLKTGKPRGTDERFRIGSITKTFVATVLLQMEAEGRLDLDDTVEHWLPGLVQGNGNDGRKITVRQLLNHTSGLFNYTSDMEFAKDVLLEGFPAHRYDTHTPRELIRVALAHKPDFTPGAKHSYSNTGYILAGLIIEKVSGNSYRHEIRERIINPLGLRNTRLPGADPLLPKPSSRAYSKLSKDPAATRVHDVTENNMTWAWAAGEGISTTGDLNRFFSALVRGKLMPEKQLAEMQATVPTPDDPVYSGYGLGLYSVRTSCQAKLWSHSGGTPGSITETVTTEDGRHTFTYNANGDWSARGYVIDAEFCGVVGKGKQGERPAPRL
ncbi:D-alanyl-D-alanine carboxypeptidase precursor [Streptomyces sp. YIM 121038]|uniref:serine hydrolase domain-containing protein n=1 Tax=Streptomyces sp. YIM 121038 TaxID=2136401 RepID=UPI001110D9A3|nr:serine hydrolase domain-containing protein [Streptomyces sp. YIM 121038]QCX77221.1 D-alanyl-D-alanine carboxypeptidase precursor [Streptomyces sp. YIM 121038]